MNNRKKNNPIQFNMKMIKRYYTFGIDFILKNSKMIFPFLAGVAVCATVVLALSLGGAKKEKIDELTKVEPLESESIEEETVDVSDIPLVENQDVAINTLINNYFTALANGDKESLISYCDTIDEDKLLEITELSKYVEKYADFQIYTKPGFTDGATVAYVCYKMYFDGKESGYPGYRTLYVASHENGVKYLKFDLNDSENDYIVQVSGQADVVDMNNRVAVEYNDLMSQEPDLLRYLNEVHNEVQVAMGVIYGQQVSGDDSQTSESGQESSETSSETGTTTDTTPVEIYAKTISTVNVRSSDSQLSDKVGKVDAGTKLKVLEQLVNGWTKIEYQGKEAYIKSEFLNVIEDAAGAEVIGTITADSNVNVRISPSETAERLGILTGGDVADLLGRENGWCKINYQGKIGYVKEEFVK